MLSLESPPFDIEGNLVYRDHAVVPQFYYAAPNPEIAHSNGQLMFDLLMYSVDLKQSILAGTSIPAELGAGFLNMGVDCPLSDAKRSAIISELANRTQIPQDQLLLAPIPYHKGTIQVIALDQFTAPGAMTAGNPASNDRLNGRPTFVENIVCSTTPSLLGDLFAILSLKLSQDGVTFLSGLYKDHAAPVGVVYNLSFYGLRPAVQAHITADLSRIYQHFGGGVGVQYKWIKAEVSAGLDFLRENNAIQIELTVEATGEEAQKSKDLAMSLFKELVVQQMFHPTAPAANPSSLGGVAPRPGTSSSSGLISLSLNYMRAEELKTITYDFSERSPEERTHSPQGFLPVLLSPDQLQQRIHQIDLHNSFFELLEVLVTGPTKEDFDALGIREIEVDLTYGEPSDGVPQDHGALLFRPDSTGDKTFAVKRLGRKSLSYSYTITYDFVRNQEASADSFRYTIPPRTTTERGLLIKPYDDFGVLDVEIEAGHIPTDVQEVDVDLSYTAKDTHFNAENQVRLVIGSPGSPTVPLPKWQVRTQEQDVSPYSATYTFYFQDKSAYRAAPQKFTSPLLRVDSPFRAQRSLLIQPNDPSQQITEITLELEYVDQPNDYLRKFLVTLDAPLKSQQLVWSILDPNQQTVRYRQTVSQPGFTNTGDWQETVDPTLIVGGPASRIATVQVQLVGPPLASLGLDAVEFNFELAVPGSPPGDPQSLLLQGTQTGGSVKLLLPPGANLQYQYQITSFKSSGQTVTSDWIQATNAMLVISTRNL